jgi:phosphate transport system permease protein
MNNITDSQKTIDLVTRTLNKRYAAEYRFKLYGLAAMTIGLACVVLLFISIIFSGTSALWQTRLRLDIDLSVEVIDPDNQKSLEVIGEADYAGLIRDALFKLFPEVTNKQQKRALSGLVSAGAEFELRDLVLAAPELIGTQHSVWILAHSNVDMLLKGYIDQQIVETERKIDDQTIAWINQLVATNRVAQHFNRDFFINGDSRDPELAGIGGAILGSFYTLLIALILSFPIGIMAAIYLEEFAPVNFITYLIEVNINNLAAVPSIVFGLLGLAVFINFFGMPRSAPLVGGLVLSLLTLPTIIIASRAALKAVPTSIREAALGIGASKMQAIFYHVLPLAMPGMLTGAIIGMARALGETAPLLMIGMVAFIVDLPQGILDPATVLPVQIFLWADSPERGFVEKTSAAIMVLLGFLILMNTIAVILRNRFERRW